MYLASAICVSYAAACVVWATSTVCIRHSCCDYAQDSEFQSNGAGNVFYQMPFPVNFVGQSLRTVPYTHEDSPRYVYSMSSMSAVSFCYTPSTSTPHIIVPLSAGVCLQNTAHAPCPSQITVSSNHFLHSLQAEDIGKTAECKVSSQGDQVSSGCLSGSVISLGFHTSTCIHVELDILRHRTIL